MNIFLPSDNAEECVMALDTLRLKKQIIECKTILNAILAYKNGEQELGYLKHPVTQFFKDYPAFVAYYGALCCSEYLAREKKSHADSDYFSTKCNELFEKEKETDGSIIYKNPAFVYYYMEGAKSDPLNIRTTDPTLVIQLFQAKLTQKWEHDKEEGRQPQWGCRQIPKFYSDYLALPDVAKRLFWGFVVVRKNDARNLMKEEKLNDIRTNNC